MAYDTRNRAEILSAPHFAPFREAPGMTQVGLRELRTLDRFFAFAELSGVSVPTVNDFLAFVEADRSPRKLADLRTAFDRLLPEGIADKTAAETRSAIFPSVGHVLAHYLGERRGQVGDPERLEYCAAALCDFWADRPTAEVTRVNCKAYAKERTEKCIKPATVRRDLSMLQSALILCEEQKRIEGAFTIWLPKKPPPRGRNLTRSELAKLLRQGAPHLRRFIPDQLLYWPTP